MKRALVDNNALSNLIKKSITDDIILGKIQPGEKLVESKYAEEFGTSRAPIREAFYLLTLEGFVQKIPRKGTVVRGYSPEEIHDLLEIRNHLENMAVAKLRDKDLSFYLDKMDEVISRMENHLSDGQYAKMNYEFHSLLLEASGSEVIKNMYSRLGTPLLSVQTMAFFDEHDVKKSISEHKQIVQLLRDGHLKEVEVLLDIHNKSVFPRVKKYIIKNA